MSDEIMPRTRVATWRTRTPGDPIGADVVYASFANQLERELTEAKAKADNAKTALLTITAGHFYQSSCRGGEMERLMNQAIEILGGKQ